MRKRYKTLFPFVSCRSNNHDKLIFNAPKKGDITYIYFQILARKDPSFYLNGQHTLDLYNFVSKLHFTTCRIASDFTVF